MVRWIRSSVVLAVVVASLTVFCGDALADGIDFEVIYRDAAGAGFNAAGAAGAERRNAMEFVLNMFETALEARPGGEQIRVSVGFESLGAGWLGWAGPTWSFNGPFPQPDTWYASPLANHIFGGDIQTDFGFDVAGAPHIYATFASELLDLGGDEFYFGTDGAMTGNVYDFASVAAHEITHGLGFLSNVDGSTGSFDDLGTTAHFPSAYDHLVYDPLIGKTLAEMTDAERLASIASGRLVWIGTNGVAANGGVAPSIHAPSTFKQGSSLSHLDEWSFPGETMTPYLGYREWNHSLSPLTLGMLEDIGWHTTVPEPGTFSLLMGTAVIVLLMRRRRGRCM